MLLLQQVGAGSSKYPVHSTSRTLSDLVTPPPSFTVQRIAYRHSDHLILFFRSDSRRSRGTDRCIPCHDPTEKRTSAEGGRPERHNSGMVVPYRATAQGRTKSAEPFQVLTLVDSTLWLIRLSSVHREVSSERYRAPKPHYDNIHRISSTVQSGLLQPSRLTTINWNRRPPPVLSSAATPEYSCVS